MRSVKAYGELPENAKINETDLVGEEDGECTFEFGEDGEVDIDDIQADILHQIPPHPLEMIRRQMLWAVG